MCLHLCNNYIFHFTTVILWKWYNITNQYHFSIQCNFFSAFGTSTVCILSLCHIFLLLLHYVLIRYTCVTLGCQTRVTVPYGSLEYNIINAFRPYLPCQQNTSSEDLAFSLITETKHYWGATETIVYIIVKLCWYVDWWMSGRFHQSLLKLIVMIILCSDDDQIIYDYCLRHAMYFNAQFKICWLNLQLSNDYSYSYSLVNVHWLL